MAEIHNSENVSIGSMAGIPSSEPLSRFCSAGSDPNLQFSAVRWVWLLAAEPGSRHRAEHGDPSWRLQRGSHGKFSL